MATFPRIYPSMSPAMFEKAQIRPVAGRWGGEGCGCLAIAVCHTSGRSPFGLTRHGDFQRMALAWERNGIRNGNASARIGRFLGFKPDYILGLLYGWDAEPLGEPHPLHTAERTMLTTAGWEDGVQCWHRLPTRTPAR